MSLRKLSTIPALTQFVQTTKTFDQVLSKIKVLSIGNGKCCLELKLDNEHVNAMGGLHGGLSAILIDCISNYALVSKIGEAGLSVDMHISYLKSARVGDVIVIDSKVVKTGLTLAFLEVEIRNKATGDLLVKGTQTLFIKQ